MLSFMHACNLVYCMCLHVLVWASEKFDHSQTAFRIIVIYIMLPSSAILIYAHAVCNIFMASSGILFHAGSRPLVTQHELLAVSLSGVLPATLLCICSATRFHSKYVVYNDQCLCVYASDTPHSTSISSNNPLDLTPICTLEWTHQL